jgi:hypothetical protein
MLRRVMGLALVPVLSLTLAAPASAGARGGAFHGGFRGNGFHGGGFRGGFHHGFHHHRGFHRFGCCFGPVVVVGSVFLGAAVAAPYYGDPYPVYAAPPAYEPAPAYQARVSAAPPVVCYVGGCYHLQGNGVSVPYQWIWVPAVPAPPPGPPNG